MKPRLRQALPYLAMLLVGVVGAGLWSVGTTLWADHLAIQEHARVIRQLVDIEMQRQRAVSKDAERAQAPK